MARRPRDIGTEAERFSIEYAKAHGFPDAYKPRQEGAKDVGDLHLTIRPKVVIEVKADKSLAYPSWLRQTETERVNAGGAVGMCFVKPEGVGEKRVHLFWALMHAGTYEALETLAGKGNFMAVFAEKGEGRRKFQPGRILDDQAAMLRGMPGTRLKPGARQISRAVGDIRFLYLPDALELLRWAGFGEPMVPALKPGGGFLTPGIQGFQADQVWRDEVVIDETATFTREKWDN